jgi:uncharacterized protein (TIGR02466 family)
MTAQTRLSLLGKQVIPLFPTALFIGRISDPSVCDRAEAKLRDMQRARQGTTTERAYVTPDDIHHLAEMRELVDLILQESGQALDFFRVRRESHYITNMWANITHPNHRHHMHIHPNCLLSGILYLKTPKSCGPTMFQDPRPGARMIEPSFTEMNAYNSENFVVSPEKGCMMMWPSYLPHAVENGNAKEDEDRIVLAFNIMIRGRIDKRTARLELK